MIKLSGLNKFYNKKKSNEIHVLNNVSIDLPEQGLVVLLGNSGCGKTTLLNTISGLDKVDSGIINVDDKIIDKYSNKIWDSLRARTIGYIFQNYNLFNDRSVFDNLEMTLNLAGIYDKVEIERRIEYSLKLVGLENYSKRKPASLSGGQQQRVGIARALVKSPKLIIADEPTGNLDSRNTFEVMDKLKSVSKYCLVVLVTHEQEIANFFADKIIEMKDGKIINEYDNNSQGSLDHRESNDIYLADLYNMKGQGSDINFEYFYAEKPKKIDIKIVEHNGRLYIKADADVPVELINSESEVRLINEKYKARDITEHETVDIDKSILGESETRRKKGSAIKSSVAMRNAIANHYKKPLSKRIRQAILFFFIGVISVYVVGNTAGVLLYNDEAFSGDRRLVTFDYEYDSYYGVYYEYETSDNTELSYENFEGPATPTIRGRLMTSDIPIQIQGRSTSIRVYNTIVSCPISIMKDSASIITGNMPVTNDEIIIDYKCYEQLSPGLKQYGIDYPEFLIGEKIALINSYSEIEEFTITGIVDSGYPRAYINLEAYTTYVENNSDDIIPSIILNDGVDLKTYVQENNYYSSYINFIENFEYEKANSLYSLVVLIIAVIIVILITTSKEIKGEFIKQSKSIATYRCLGATKLDISKEYMFRSIIKSSTSSLIGWLIASGIAIYVSKLLLTQSGRLLNIKFNYNVWLALLVLICLYGFNLAVTAFRLAIKLKKTPAEMLAKYDI